MVGVKLGDQRCFGGGRGGVVGYLPADAQLGVVAELPDPPPAAVAHGLAGARAAELIEPFALDTLQRAATAGARIAYAADRTLQTILVVSRGG